MKVYYSLGKCRPLKLTDCWVDKWKDSHLLSWLSYWKSTRYFHPGQKFYNIHDALLKLSIERAPSSHSSHSLERRLWGTRTWNPYPLSLIPFHSLSLTPFHSHHWANWKQFSKPLLCSQKISIFVLTIIFKSYYPILHHHDLLSILQTIFLAFASAIKQVLAAYYCLKW